MRDIIVRYHSSLCCCSFTEPFETGLRHLKVAFCNDSKEILIDMAKERIIYRPYESDNEYKLLTKSQRFTHLIVGLLETIGYLTIVVSLIVYLVDRCLNIPSYPKGGYPLRTHINEGGSFESFHHASIESRRKNPFDTDGKSDPFYAGASWNKK